MPYETLVDGLCFGEGPRWRGDRLWFSDMHAGCVMTVDLQGTLEQVMRIEGDEPSGLGWLPTGELLIVSMQRRQVLRYDGAALTVHADLAQLASFHCNDMVVAADGTAWVGNFGFDLYRQASPQAAELIRVDPDGSARIAARDLMFPNGTVITPDGRTLIVGESFGGCLTAFDIDPQRNLVNRRSWAQCPEGAVPDGICLDEAGGIWVASPTSHECLRITEGGTVTDRIDTRVGAFACMLGGPERRTLMMLVAGTSDPQRSASERSGAILTCDVQYAAAGWP